MQMLDSAMKTNSKEGFIEITLYICLPCKMLAEKKIDKNKYIINQSIEMLL